MCADLTTGHHSTVCVIMTMFEATICSGTAFLYHAIKAELTIASEYELCKYREGIRRCAGCIFSMTDAFNVSCTPVPQEDLHKILCSRWGSWQSHTNYIRWVQHLPLKGLARRSRISRISLLLASCITRSHRNSRKSSSSPCGPRLCL